MTGPSTDSAAGALSGPEVGSMLWVHEVWGAAPEFGVLYSHACWKVYDDLVEGPYASLAAASERRETVLRAQQALAATVVARLDGHWVARSGETPVEVLRRFERDWLPFGSRDLVLRGTPARDPGQRPEPGRD